MSSKRGLPVRANPFQKDADHLSHSLLAIPEIEAALLAVFPKHRRFCVAVGCGMSIPEAAALCGYKNVVVGSNGYKVLRSPDVKKAVDLISLHYSFYVGGIAVSRKRNFLWELATENKTKNPAASVAALKLIAALDGDVQPAGTGVGGITININGLGGASVGQVVDGALEVAGQIIDQQENED